MLGTNPSVNIGTVTDVVANAIPISLANHYCGSIIVAVVPQSAAALSQDLLSSGFCLCHFSPKSLLLGWWKGKGSPKSRCVVVLRGRPLPSKVVPVGSGIELGTDVVAVMGRWSWRWNWNCSWS